jgi:hypothetical protein
VQVEIAAARRWKQEGVSGRAGSRSSASNAIACSGTARMLRRVFVLFKRPCANALRT